MLRSQTMNSSKKVKTRKFAEIGQSLAEFAAFSSLAVLVALIAVNFIPLHRAKTTAVTASYACAQFLAESRNPANAVANATRIAQEIIQKRWSGSNATFSISVQSADEAGGQGTCVVSYKVKTFLVLLGAPEVSGRSVSVSRMEKHKSLWK